MIVALQGDYGKPRPALVVQSDLLANLPSVMICPTTTALRTDVSDGIRPLVAPTPINGLRETSQLMLDKLSAIPREKVGQVIGKADEALMVTVTASLAIMLDIGVSDASAER